MSSQVPYYNARIIPTSWVSAKLWRIVDKLFNGDMMRVLYILACICMLLTSTDAAFAANKKHKSRKYIHKTQPATRKAVRRAKATVKPKARSSAKRFVAAAPVAQINGSSQLAAQLNSIIENNSSGADVAVYVRSMKHGDSLYARNINQPMTPASTMKIFTAEAALLYLGPDYRFATQVLSDTKEIKNGVLQGNLYIALNGDPTLTYYDLVELFMNLESQQITGIAGNVYIDNTAYDSSFYGPGWVWKDKNYCYAAPISASIINHNCLSFQVTPAKSTGQAAQVVTSPKYFYPAIRNSVTTSNSSRGCGVHLSANSGSMITIDGCMPKGRYAWGVSYVVSDIPEYNRALFKNLLNRLNIKVYGNVTFGTTPAKASVLVQHASKPLRDMVMDMLKKSDNIIAGALFKKIGQLYTRQPGSWQNGGQAVTQILNRRAAYYFM